MEIYRDAGGGLGLSVKGGAEHRIPALISRIIPGQAAAHTEQLFVGDAILKVRYILRTVEIYRDAGGGLGLSVKGGAEHRIPALISRIIPGQAAAHTEQLFVGDAILKVGYIL